MDEPSGGPVLDRAEQRRRFGMDCGDAIRFEAGAWAPGGEHVRKLTVRNVSQRSLKFKYELPSTKFFSMAFPTVITLSSGMQTVLDLTFRPVRLEEYDDYVGFHVHVIEGGVTATSGRFRIPVTARIATLSVSLPRGLDFGFCPTRELTHKTFQLRNTGQLDALFEWKLAGAGNHGQPFAIEPVAGRVPAGEAMDLTVSFNPTTATVYVSTTVCNVRADAQDDAMAAQHVRETMKVSGISKFTHISASETEINFGDALVGAPASVKASSGLVTSEKEFVLRNRSLVRASFRVMNVESDHDPVFFFSPTSGVVDPESFMAIKVRYTPLSAGTFTCDHFDIVTPGSNTVRVTCKGRAVGPAVSLWKKDAESNFVRTRSVNFQDVAVGSQPAARVVTLRNESPLEVLYHFDAQEDGVFRFDRVNGRIPPLLDCNVTITFSPTQAGNFYRRFFILILNQTTQYVDVLGTGYDDKTRPSPFQQAHVDAYRLRVEAGLGLLSPDQLENYQQDHGDALFLKGALKRAKDEEASRQDGEIAPGPGSLPPPSALQTRSGEALLSDVEVAHEYFVSVDDKGNPVEVTTPQMDFGNCGIVQFPSKKVLHVTNNTHGKVTCSWRVAAGGGGATSEGSAQDDSMMKRAFQVFPGSSDIAAGATAEFRVAFQPTQVNTYYFAELEGYVAFKSNRTFRLVNADTLTPPWCVTSKVCGNTFPSPSEQFLAKVRFRLAKNKVHFPPCHLGDSVFQTLVVENTSDTPALFVFADDPSEVFQCKPPCGYIPAKSFHLVAVRFAPRQAKSYTHLMQCVVNNAFSKPEVLELAGICAVPRLALPDCAGSSETGDAKIFVKPTAIGLQSLRRIQVMNSSRVPLVFRWEVPRKYQGVFQVRPKLGRLNGCESAAIECVFTPGETRDYASRFTLSAKSISLAPHEHKKAQPHASIPVLQELSVRAVTKGTVGAVRFHPRALQFATILVNTSSKQHFYLENTADCDLVYRLEPTLLSTATSSDRPRSSRASAMAPAALAFSESRGCISAQSRKKIAVTFQPSLAGAFAFKVSCEIGDQADSSALSPWYFPRFLEAACTIRGDASFPTVEIQDIRVPGTSPALAWEQFQCSNINRYMVAPLPSEEGDDDEQDTGRPRSAPSISGAEQPEMLSARSAAAQHSHFVLPFSPSPLGSPPEQAFLLLRNPGNLVVEFSLRLPKEGSVEIEHWAETGAPSPEEVRTDAIIDAKVFGISPRRATLKPQQSVLLTLSYAYSSQLYGGNHDLPIRLEVDKGKQVTLELHGTTLAPREPKLFVSSHVFHLSPVMIGEYRRRLPTPEHASEYGKEHEHHHAGHQTSGSHAGGPPVQQIQVFNRGDSAFRLDVGSNSFDRANTDCYGYPVLSCRATSEIVPARSSVYIDVAFNPIEAKTVRADLILKAHGLMGRTYKEAVMITVVATAFHPRQWTLQQIRREQLPSTLTPRKQLLAVPGRSARFASDSVDFGHVPMHSQVHRLLILKNDCERQTPDSCAFTFQWDPSNPLVADGTVTFSPARGELAPGEKLLVRASIQTASEAIVVNHDIACWITYASPPLLSSTDSGNQRGSALAKREPAPRTSVIHRSTATQEATTLDGSRSPVKTLREPDGDDETRKPQTSASTSKPTGKRKAVEKTAASQELVSRSSSSVPEPVFVRIYAHALPDAVFEKHYPRDAVERLPLLASGPSAPTIAASPASSHGSRSARTLLSISSRSSKTPSTPLTASGASTRRRIFSDVVRASEEETAKCRDTVGDVVEALVVDVLNSSDVQTAMDEQLGPLSRCDRAALHSSASRESTRTPTLFPRARKSDDCRSILSNVLENTVSNVLQELFHGDLESELLCLPRKAVFPGASRAKAAFPRELDPR